MLKTVITIFLLLNFSMSAFSKAHNKPSVSEIVSKIKDKNAIGISIVDLDSKKEIFSNNKNKLFVPASLSKIFTSIAALKQLGPGYKFQTPIKYSGKISSGKLDGNLYIIGQGDPNIVSEKLFLIANTIKLYGVESVNGDICYDDSYFDEASVLRQEKRREQNPYNAPLSALSINYNSASFVIRPNPENIAEPVVVKQEPVTSDYIKIENKVKLSKGEDEDVQAQRQNTFKDNETYRFMGSIGRDSKPVLIYRSIDRASMNAAYMFKKALEIFGVKVTGTVKQCKASTDLKELYTYKSDELSTLIALMNKFSNNFMADQLFLSLGAQMFGAPGTPEKAENAVKAILGKMPLKSKDFELVSGSGLTYDNKISPSQITDLLQIVYNDYSVYPELVASLARTQTDGTLKRWFKTVNMDSLRAKTGSLSKEFFVAGIAGILSSNSGKHYAFSIITNTPNRNTKLTNKVRDIEEDIVTAIKLDDV